MSASSTDAEYPGTPRRKHRHDLGHEDHGPVYAQGTTRAIQALLGLWIALSCALVIYALIDGTLGGSRARGAAPAAPSASEPAH